MAILNLHWLSVFKHKKIVESPTEVVEDFQKIIQAYNLTPHDNEKREVYFQTILRYLETLDIPENDLQQAQREIEAIHKGDEYPSTKFE